MVKRSLFVLLIVTIVINSGVHGKRFFSDEGRFTQVDPLWQKYPSTSPYVRVANNPLHYVDKNGEQLGAAVGAVSGLVYGFDRSMDYLGGEISNTGELVDIITTTAFTTITGGITGALDPTQGVLAAPTAILVSEIGVQLYYTGEINSDKAIKQTLAATAGSVGGKLATTLLNPTPQAIAATIITGYITSLLTNNTDTKRDNYVELLKDEDKDNDENNSNK